ncbi:MAG: hypothetical protein DWC00_04845 [Candidatus Poseidoniales archaeon]|nr:MAG: hypothetical protein DWC00_04845 [Candidatus Poseidoniales archaeon]
MIPQSMRPLLALITILLGLIVIANHWVEFVSDTSDLLTSHVLGFLCALFGINLLSAPTAESGSVQARYQEDTQTKF